jgi:hypothetical protein
VLLQNQAAAIRRPRVIANPAEGCKTASEFLGDRRRQPGVRVVESACEQIAFTSAVQRKQPRVPFARTPLALRDQQIHFASQARQQSHHRAPRTVFHHQLRNKKRIREIGERIIESLLRVHASQSIEIGVSIFTNAHVPSTSEHAVAQKGVHARDSLGCIERGRARRDSICGERSLRCLRDWLLRERMRQRFERSVVLKREMRTFVRFDKDEDRRCVITRDIARRISRCSRP